MWVSNNFITLSLLQDEWNKVILYLRGRRIVKDLTGPNEALYLIFEQSEITPRNI